MLDLLGDFTLRNVLLSSVLLGVSSGVLGCFAVLRQQSLLGDTLSHAALPGVALGFLITGTRQTVPILLGALLAGAAAALTVTLLTRRSRLKTDAALGVVLSIYFALGIVLLTYIGNQNNAGQAGLETYLFGQAAATLPSDVYVISFITLAALVLVMGLWKEFKVMSFDPDFAQSLGLPVLGLELLMTAMIALAIVIGLQIVGVILMAAMIIAPAAAARQWSKRLETMVALAALFGALSGVSGTLLSSSLRNLPTGPVIVIAASIIVLVSLVFAPERGLLWSSLKLRKESRNLRSQRVLLDLYKLASEHDDPTYASELGMLSSYYGVNAARVLQRLKQQDLVETGLHMPEEGPHWRLTPKGIARAETALRDLGAPGGAP